MAELLENSGFLFSAAVFATAVVMFLFIALTLAPVIQTRRRINEQLLEEGYADRRSLAAQSELVRISARQPVEQYFKAAEKERGEPDALEARLFRAGFYNPSAPMLYTVSRILCVFVSFFVFYWLLSVVVPASLPNVVPLLGAGMLAVGSIVVPSILLDLFESREKEKFRRGFPDFMDMMITCADAGMSLEAAVARVSEEMAGSHRSLGIQLAIMSLQIRAGKPLREGLRELADRIGLDEARSLAVLFRQSEELGTSLTDALRVYSDEMRTQRILRAEEKANSLPVRMVIPLGICVFPVVLMIILLPVVIRIKEAFF